MSAVTHVSEVVSVGENDVGTQVYKLRPPQPLKVPVSKGRRVGIQSYKYTTLERLMAARILNDI